MTDASPSGFGACEAPLTPPELEAEGAYSERWRFRLELERGEGPRADALRAADPFSDPATVKPRGKPARWAWGPQEVFPNVSQHVLAKDRWKTVVSAPWGRREVIHILEARACSAAVRRRVRTAKAHGRRLLGFSDSMAAVLAFTKGRSTDDALLQLCRQFAAVGRGSTGAMEAGSPAAPRGALGPDWWDRRPRQGSRGAPDGQGGAPLASAAAASKPSTPAPAARAARPTRLTRASPLPSSAFSATALRRGGRLRSRRAAARSRRVADAPAAPPPRARAGGLSLLENRSAGKAMQKRYRVIFDSVMMLMGRSSDEETLLPIGMRLCKKHFDQACVDLGLEQFKLVTCQARRGGAAGDILLQRRTLEEARKRGTWETCASLRRYEKSGRVQKVMRTTPPHLLAFARLACTSLE
ncbi:unnamed protein product, partial [Prorocentrum cordatum]